jgi:hypothetical protein
MAGTTHMSCAISTAKVVRPCSVASSPPSPSVPMTMAVDDMAKAKPMMVATSQAAMLCSSSTAWMGTGPGVSWTIEH